MYKGHQLKSKLQNTGTRSTAASAPPPVLSPSNVLPPHSCHCAFIPTTKNSARVAKISLFYFYTFNCLSLKEPKSASVRK